MITKLKNCITFPENLHHHGESGNEKNQKMMAYQEGILFNSY